ncbi:MAG TPA: hypothetical protein PLZ84_06980, partial [Clostridia bacterium]|nr:hypothetical protein [Clostridia bacterium]
MVSGNASGVLWQINARIGSDIIQPVCKNISNGYVTKTLIFSAYAQKGQILRIEAKCEYGTVNVDAGGAKLVFFIPGKRF